MNLPEVTKNPIYGSSMIGASYPMSMSVPYPFKGAARLEITRQPKKRGYRFRYLSEGKTHGMLPGEPSDSGEKVFPSVRIVNHLGNAKVVMYLVTEEDPQFIHPHTLLIDKIPVGGYHIFDVNEDFDVQLKNVAIQHVNKQDLPTKMLDRHLQSKYIKEVYSMNQYGANPKIDIDTFASNLADKAKKQPFFDHRTKQALTGEEEIQLSLAMRKKQKEINMSSCRLCFIAFLQDPETGKFDKILQPVHSDLIIDGKKKEGAPLKIIRVSHVAGSVEGGKEVWLLSDKIDAEDTEVYFWERSQDKQEMFWEGFGEFNKTDVYKQALIVFKIPPYCNQNIDQPRTVNLQLRRKKDRNCVSDVHHFSYKPKHYDRYGLREKRRKNLPPEIYESTPPIKRQHMDYAADSPPASTASKYQPYDSAHINNPTLSDIVMPQGRNEYRAIVDASTRHSPAVPTTFNGPLDNYRKNHHSSKESDTDEN
ncbi:nuclear factor NF-kappa-B p105 subunit-like [Clytia hemisphaerica]|uniref:RHD domain-containing protein n=1 Tax=Clytia hemisphaerica TaxID=252671 RepID=A0A7M5X4B7_9CNID|eukprot:TCONS_00005923-protein